MRVNPVWRNDLRQRFTSRKMSTVLSVYLAALALVAFFSLPPDLGRLDDLRQEGLLLAFLIIQSVLATYLTSATSSGEIAVAGEKGIWDLAASPFPAGVIARGKVMTSATFAGILLGLAWPVIAIVAGIRGEPLSAVARGALIGLPFAATLGALGVLYAGLIDSDTARTLVHWLTLLVLVVGATALPPPWDLLSPVRLISQAERSGISWPVLLAALFYVLAALPVGAAIAGRTTVIRAEARPT